MDEAGRALPSKVGQRSPMQAVEEADTSQTQHLPPNFALSPFGSGERARMSRLACKYAVC